MSWSIALREWSDLLSNIEDARSRLHCSRSSAWFRGQTDSDWDLYPSLFRPGFDDRLSHDQAKLISNAEAIVSDRRLSLRNNKKRIGDLNRAVREARKNNELVMRNLNEAQQEAEKSYQSTIKRDLERQEQIISVVKATHYGERDAFIDFGFRSGNEYRSSWEQLAAMQHFGVPTRLLDWTEVLALSLYFALEKYTAAIEACWKENLNSKKELFYYEPPGLSKPVIWIMNPYGLARNSTRNNSIPYISRSDMPDYFESFFVDRNWTWENPVPSYSPWTNPRLAAQQGMFTVHGLSRLPLNGPISKGYLARVEVSVPAAVYGVKHLKTFLSLDKYTMYRDQDNLGKRVKETYLIP